MSETEGLLREISTSPVLSNGDDERVSVSVSRETWDQLVEALEKSEAALADLGACADPDCEALNCNHALCSVRASLAASKHRGGRQINFPDQSPA